MSLSNAAYALLVTLRAPKGAVNVLPLRDAEGERLIVWIDQKYIGSIKAVPEEYEGYQVKVAPRPEAIAYR